MAKLNTRQLARAAGRGLNRLGWPGATGLGLLAFCGAAYVTALLPAQTGLEQAQRRALLLQAQNHKGAEQTGREAPAEQLAAFYRFFPDGHSEADWLEKIYQVAQEQGLSLDQGDYRPLREKTGKLTRYQVTLPVTGPYPQIRKFLAAVLSEVPIASLDSVDFSRQKIGDGSVEAKIRFSLYLK